MAPGLYLVAVVCLLLYPYELYPRNGVDWLGPGAGIYFDGRGIAYTELGLAELAGTPPDQLTVELWLHERITCENRGLRAIFSIWERGPGPPFFLGQFNGRLLLFSPDGAWVEPWRKQFILEQKMTRGEDHFVAVAVEPGRRAIFLDDLVVEDRRFPQIGTPALDLSGRLILGASPVGRNRWCGEMKALALYRRALVPEEITTHRDQAREAGVGSLSTAEDLIALFAFEEGAGESAGDLARGRSDIHIPARFSAVPETLFHLPALRFFPSRGNHGDALLNVLFFVPLGWLLAAFTSRRSRGHCALVACGVVLAGGLLSLALEAAQLLIPDRSAGPIDVAANTLGTAIGVLAFSIRSHGRAHLWGAQRSRDSGGERRPRARAGPRGV